MPDRLFTDRAALASLCRRRHIRRLSLFGSVLKGNARPDSDVDLLVEFEKDAKGGYFELCGIEIELAELIGRSVDLRTEHDLSGYFRQEVVQNALQLYAA